jgi:uncharacterized membrane protein YbhN (UPF0104 family)
LDASTALLPALQPKSPGETGRRRKWWWVLRLLALIVVAALVATRLRQVPIRGAFDRLHLRDVVLIVFLLSPLAVLLRALRWRYLLPGGNNRPVRDYVGAYLVGALANSLLLGRFGDLAKARFICGPRLDYAQSVTVVAIDRLLEGVALLFIFSLALLNSHLPAWAYSLAWTAGLASVLMLVVLRLILYQQRRFLATVARATGYLPAFLRDRADTLGERLLAGCEALADYRRVLVALLYAVAVWCVEITTVTIFLVAFAVPRPWLVPAVVLVVVLNFGMLVPISPGAVGIYQLLCSFALSLWGVDRVVGFSLGIAMQTLLFVPLYLAGFVWLLVRVGIRNQ